VKDRRNDNFGLETRSASLLEPEPDPQVVGEAADGLETMRLAETLRPDILVVDVMMGSISGIEVTRQVSKNSLKTSVVILSMYSNEVYVLEALKAGAKAYVLKESTAAGPVKAVRKVAAGRCYLSSSLSQ
jgi:DNA-binding NarL/FixJ family response regulator